MPTFFALPRSARSFHNVRFKSLQRLRSDENSGKVTVRGTMILGANRESVEQRF